MRDEWGANGWYIGGNDYEIFEDQRTIGHTVTKPEDTMAELKTLFDL
jgi:phosphomannomutase